MGSCRTPAFEEIFETYYSYAFTQATQVSVDYQLIINPAYNTDRGPANVFSGRLHPNSDIDRPQPPRLKHHDERNSRLAPAASDP